MPEEEGVREEMALLGRLVKLTFDYFAHVAGAYIFFAYGIALPATLMLFEGLWESYGILGSATAAELGTMIGAVLGTILVVIIINRVFSPVAESGRGKATRVFAVNSLLFFAAMASGMYGLALADPSLAGVSWYYGLTLTLALLAPLMGGWSFMVAAITLAAMLPIVLYTVNFHIALAGLMLGYLAGGSYSIWRASRILARA